MRHWLRRRPSRNPQQIAPLHLRVGCTWRDADAQASPADSVAQAPAGFVQYRKQMMQAGAPITFRPPLLNVKVAVRFGCIGAAAMSGRYAAVVTPSNAKLCGNKSSWWGFIGQKNVDGTLRSLAGPKLEETCEAIPPAVPGGLEKLRPSTVRATSAHELNARHLIHALAPISAYPRQPAELALRRTYARCFELAADLEADAVALPALGCGVAGFPAAIGARAAVGAIDDAASVGLWCAEAADDGGGADPGGAPPTLLEFVLLDERVYAAFADAAHARWGRRPSSS